MNRWSRFKEILGELLLGPLNKVLGVLKPVVLAMDDFAATHPRIAQLAAAVIGLASAAVIFGGAWQLLGIGRTLEFLRVGKMLTTAWTAAQWLLNAAIAKGTTSVSSSSAGCSPCLDIAAHPP
jgi:hypothetical protein